MSDVVSDAGSGRAGMLADNLPELSVSELSQQVKRTVEVSFDRVRVRGEVSRPSFASSGHVYLTLKDDRAVLDAVCWRRQVPRLSVRPEDGMEVICTGRLTTYPGRSKYQLIVEGMEVAGEGALLRMLEERRIRLAAEGLFDDSRKKALPFAPWTIGVVTSPTGAVIQDIRHRLSERFPVHVLLWPVRVQGDGASREIARAIRGFDSLEAGGRYPRPDLLIVARGGGSLEDLWCFNEEEVVRAVAECGIPVISAVGHETDTTLIDFAADHRAPTPSAAAERAVPVRADLLARTAESGTRLLNAATRILGHAGTRVEGLARGLGDPALMIESRAQAVDHGVHRLDGAIENGITRRSIEISRYADRLADPRSRLATATGAVAVLEQRLHGAGERAYEACRQRADHAGERLRLQPMVNRLEQAEAGLARTGSMFETAVDRTVGDAGSRLEALARLLEAASFERVLERGFAVVRDRDGEPVANLADTRRGQKVKVQFHDGEAEAVIGNRQVRDSSRQGSLF